ncbi:MAG: hypothetical protein H0W72_11190 [Planctomycetes bacterium]|nr:hypothetical protein [Planctomycetota bacterium]
MDDPQPPPEYPGFDSPRDPTSSPDPAPVLPAALTRPIDGPQATIRAWLPHLVMLGLLVLAVAMVAMVFAPLRDPALLAASMAAMTYAILFLPIHRLTTRLLPRVTEGWRRSISAGAATAILVAMLVSPVALLLLTGLERPADTPAVLLGLALRDEAQVAKVADLAAHQAAESLTLYPDLPLDPEAVRRFLMDAFGHSRNQAVLEMIASGNGGFLAQTVLAVILLFAFFERGPWLVRTLLAHAPLADDQRQLLRRRFRHVVLHLLNDHVASAVAKGLALGGIAWALAGINFFVVAAVATVLSLIPVIGFASVWLPLASLLWAQQYQARAIGIAVAGFAAGYLVDYLGQRLTRGLDKRGEWMGFMLFLSLIGGLLAFGAKGLVIGPMAVVILAVLGGFWLPLYGVRDREAEAAQSP